MERRVKSSEWRDTISETVLRDAGSRTVKIGNKQIALFARGDHIYACNNRCPHEGYPLKEGTLSDTCTLTCNWHNWKFDLRTGENTIGGDHLRVYPVRVVDGTVQVDVANASPEERIERALENLKDSFDDHEYDRMARELARMEKAGGDILDALRATIHWTHNRFKYGMGDTHAPMAAADWLSLRNTYAADAPSRIMPVHEAIANFAWDSRRQPQYPYTADRQPWNEDAFVRAVEDEDEAAAISYIRGGIAAGLKWDNFERAFARAALTHYLDFGHGAIYVQKTGELLDHLGDGVLEPLLLLLTRGIVFSWREDLIPEFRFYAEALEAWGHSKTETVSADQFDGLGPRQAMALAVTAKQSPEELFDILFEVNARSLLHFDLKVQNATDQSVAHNHTWLSVTHEVTFANAARTLAEKYPELWPSALLQMCCFFGRNSACQDKSIQDEDWLVDDTDAFLESTLNGLFDHGQFEYIVTAHLVKTASAVADEVARKPGAPWVPILTAGLNRFMNSPLKRRHPMRTAKQAVSFVAIED